MAQALSMAVLNRAEQLEHVLPDVFFLDETRFHDLLEDLSSFAQFHDEVLLLFILLIVLKFDYVWMVQVSQTLQLSVDDVDIFHLLFGNAFDGECQGRTLLGPTCCYGPELS